jgi:hypothetical protein
MGGPANRQSMYPPLSQSEPLAQARARARAHTRKPLVPAGNLTLLSGSASLEVSMQDAPTERE